MNKMILTITAKPGHAQEVAAGAKSLLEYVKNKYDLQSEAYAQVLGGAAGTIFFIADYNDAASAQAAQTKIMADKEYWTLARKFSDFVMAPPTLAFLQKI